MMNMKTLIGAAAVATMVAGTAMAQSPTFFRIGTGGAGGTYFPIGGTIANGISDKMVARHPHIFGDESRDKTAEQQTADWEKIKAAERAAKGPARVLDDVALNLPALTRAVKLQKRAARVGFDWPDTGDVIAKLQEEAAELTEPGLSDAEKFEEFGDMMFVMANLARHMKIDPEEALRATNAKFTRRFEFIEDELAKAGKSPDQSDLAEMDALWDQAKLAEKT